MLFNVMQNSLNCHLQWGTRDNEIVGVVLVLPIDKANMNMIFIFPNFPTRIN